MECTDSAAIATFFSGDALVPGGTVTLSEEAAHHMHVARIAIGERVALRDGAGTTAQGTVVKMSRGSALIDITDVREVPRPAPIHLLAPVGDRERMLWLAEKATELGITSWRPVMWRRSRSVSPRGDGPTFQGKVRGRMRSALIQCGGAWLPDVFPEASVDRAVAAAPRGTRLLLAADGDPIAGVTMRAPIIVALGPEGGIEAAERDSLVAADFVPVRLANSTLRFETAGIAAIAIAVAGLSLSGNSDGEA